MNIHISNCTHHCNWMKTIQNYIGTFLNHVVVNLRMISSYLKYNEVTKTSSVFLVNFGLINLADKLTEIACNRFSLKEGNALEIGKWSFKAGVLLVGMAAFNRVMEMQLSKLYVVSSVIAALALQVLWQRMIKPPFDQDRIKTEDQSDSLNKRSGASSKEAERSSHSQDKESGSAKPSPVEKKENEDLDRLLPKDEVHSQVAKGLGLTEGDGELPPSLLESKVLGPREDALIEIYGEG